MGWHSVCPKCGSSFDVDVPKGKFVMAFASNQHPECFTFDWRDDNALVSYYAFDSVNDFLDMWIGKVDEPDSDWYWVLEDGEVVLRGEVSPYDLFIFQDRWDLVFAGED